MNRLNIFKIIATSIVLLGSFTGFYAMASERDSGEYVYAFHLWYDRGTLSQDGNFKSPFDLIAKQYKAGQAMGFFSGEILSVKDESLAKFAFSLGSIPVDGSGKLTTEGPYFANAKTVIFYNNKKEKVLKLDLAPDGPLCNENGACDANFGESNQNCPADCSGADAMKNNAPVQKKIPLSSIILALIIGSVAIAFTAWLIIRRRRS